jgi:pimeloyl-ACP methyl ester carboxylesterase
MIERAQPTSKFVTVNGLNLHYLEWGKTGMPVVVCVHGYTSSAQAFNALARHLQHHFHIIAMDVRGHGESAWSPTGLTSTGIRQMISPPLSTGSNSHGLR